MKYTFAFLLLVLSASASAHHSRIQYDTTAIVEMRGEIVAVRWRNPHVMFTLRLAGDSGATEDWMLEAGSIYMLGRTGVDKNMMQPGDRVDVAGYASKTGSKEFYLTNVRLSGGQEFVMVPAAKPYFSDTAIGGRDQWSADRVSDAGAARAKQGIFRVWSLDQIFTNLTGSGSSGLPLTEQARAARAAFDPLRDDPSLDCIEPGMPDAMTGPHPIQFIEGDNEITVLIAEFDISRTIHLGELEDAASLQPSKQGYSQGTWKEDVLEVYTTRVDWPFFDGTGTPLGPSAEMIEQFSLSDDGLRLNYEMLVTDPSTFTEPVSISKYWVDLAEPMEVYDCVAGSELPAS